MSICSNEVSQFEYGVRMAWPGARGDVHFSYIDGETTYRIKFSNGALIEGRVRTDVITDAIAYARATMRITGKPP